MSMAESQEDMFASPGDFGVVPVVEEGAPVVAKGAPAVEGAPVVEVASSEDMFASPGDHVAEEVARGLDGGLVSGGELAR